MDRDRILGIQREHEEQLKATGLVHLRLFGSVARGDSRPDSDVDLLFAYDDCDFHNLLRAYGSQEDVTDMLGVPVHLSSEKHMRPEILNQVLPETINVF